MPYTVYKIANENKYQVVNRKTGEVHAYKTTYKNAIKQIRLMSMMDSKRTITRKNRIYYIHYIVYLHTGHTKQLFTSYILLQQSKHMKFKHCGQPFKSSIALL